MWGQPDPSGFGMPQRDPSGFGKPSLDPSGFGKPGGFGMKGGGGKPFNPKGDSPGPAFGKGCGFKGKQMKGGEPAEDTWDEPMDESMEEDPSQGKGGPMTVRPPMWKGKGKDESQDGGMKGNQPCFGKGSMPCFGKGAAPAFGKGKKDQPAEEESSDKGAKGGPAIVRPPFGKGSSPALGKGSKSGPEPEEDSGPAVVKPPGTVVKPPTWKGKGKANEQMEEEDDGSSAAPVTVAPPARKGQVAKGGGKQSSDEQPDDSWENAEAGGEEENAEEWSDESWNKKDSWKKNDWEEEDEWQEEDGGEEDWGEEDEDEEEWGDDDGEEGGWVWQAGEDADEEDWGEGAEEEGYGEDDQMEADEEEEEGNVVLHFTPACFTKIIGRAGGAINKVRQESGAEVTIKKTTRSVEVSIAGTPAAVKTAKEQVIGLAEEEPDPSLGEEEQDEDAIEEIKLLIDIGCLGALLGKGGENIKNVRAETGADINVKQVEKGKGGKNKGKIDVFISGTHDQVELAKTMLEESVPNFIDRTPGADGQAAAPAIPAPPPKPPGAPPSMTAIPPDGFGTLTLHFDVRATGRIIGSGGGEIKQLREQTSADVRVKKIWNDTKCEVVITGKVAHVQQCMKALIELTMKWGFSPEFRGFEKNEESGGGGKGDKGKGNIRRARGGGEYVTHEKGLAGHIIGVGGKKLQQIRDESGAEILISKFGLTLEFQISGAPLEVQKAKALLEKASTDGATRGWGNKNWTNERDTEEDEDEYKSFLPRTEAMKIIGKGGRTSKRIRYESGAHVVCDIDNEVDEGVPLRIAGTLKAVDSARSMILDVLRTDGGGAEAEWEEESYIKVSQQEARRLIGKGGENVKKIKDTTKSRITVDMGDRNEESVVLVRIAGPMENVKSAQKIIVELLDGKRLDDIIEEHQNDKWNDRWKDKNDRWKDRRQSWGNDRGDRYDRGDRKGYSKGKDRDGKGKGKKGKGKKRRREW